MYNNVEIKVSSLIYLYDKAACRTMRVTMKDNAKQSTIVDYLENVSHITYKGKTISFRDETGTTAFSVNQDSTISASVNGETIFIFDTKNISQMSIINHRLLVCEFRNY